MLGCRIDGAYHRLELNPGIRIVPGDGYPVTQENASNVARRYMDFCFNCGLKTDPDWVFCRSCGSALDEGAADLAVPAASAGVPKVELISRGWDDQIVETIEVDDDPLADDEISPSPVPPGGIEVTVDEITIVDAPVEPPTEEPATPSKTSDSWDHLRPHGELPPVRRQVTLPGRVSQALVLLAAFGALVAAAIHFYVNTRLNAFAEGRATERTIDDLQVIADISLIVAASLIAVAAAGLGWWAYRSRTDADFRPGQAGILALSTLIAGWALVGWALTLDSATVTEAIGVNSLVVLGLGLVMTACLATVRFVERIDRKEPA
jgi:hypothetical protein